MKKPIIISLLCVSLALVILFWGFREDESPTPQPRESYALVIENDTGSFVMQLRKGMQQAAEESGVLLTVCSVSEAGAMEGLSGAVMWLADPSAALNRLADVPKVVVGQTWPGVACVLGDDRSAGAQLMLHALAQHKPEAITLILDDEDEHALARGAAAGAAAGEADIFRLAYGDGSELPPRCQAAVATSLRGTLWLVEMKRQGRFSGSVLGVDTDGSRVADLEAGLVDAMAMDSPYAMGYLALLNARKQADGDKPENTFSKVLIATRQNMYLAENVKQIFPLLQ